jgi:hypothetical protein
VILRNLQSGYDEGDVRNEILDDFLANSSESIMPYTGYRLAYPGLVNSHILLLPANHIRPVEDHNEPGDGVELGDGVEDGVGECQEEGYNQESPFYNSEDIRGPY